MKKLTAIFGTVLFGSLLLLQTPLSYAQVMTNGVLGVPASGQPMPQSGGSGATTGTTTGTTGGTRTGGGQTGGTRTPPGGVKTTGTTSTVPPATDIPFVPIGVTQETVPSTTQDTTLVCDQDKCAATVQQTMGNEIIAMTVLLMGSMIGGILWMLGLLSMKKGVVEREGHRMERQNRFHFKKMLTEQKTQAYNSYIDTVMNIVEKIQMKKTLGTEDYRNFQESSVFINMHGSNHLRSMNDHIANLINSAKPLATSDKLHLKSELSKTIRADLLT